MSQTTEQSCLLPSFVHALAVPVSFASRIFALCIYETLVTSSASCTRRGHTWMLTWVLAFVRNISASSSASLACRRSVWSDGASSLSSESSWIVLPEGANFFFAAGLKSGLDESEDGDS